VDSIIAAYNLNERRLERKTACFKWAFALAAIATVCLGVAIVTHILKQAPGLPFYDPPPPTSVPSPTPTGVPS
jgi:hypothetical protein